jgi:hypothetical protein
MTEISCVYSRTAAGRLILAFTCDLWKRLACSQPLVVQVEGDPSCARLLGTNAGNAVKEEMRLIADDIARKTGLAENQFRLSAGCCGELIVDHNLAFKRTDLSILYPARESTLLGRGDGPILVPFGDGTSVLPAAAMAFDMAAKLSLPVVLYHTTWVDPDLDGGEPADHMCRSARDIHNTLLAQAQAVQVQVSTIIETADDVVEGLLQCAMRQSASLIVMSRSAKTRIGCYVAQTLTKTPVPVLALASTRRQA